MALEYADIFHALGIVNGGSPATFINQRGCSAIVRTGPGVYTLTLDVGVDPSAVCVFASPVGVFAPGVIRASTLTSPTDVVIESFDLAGNPTDNVWAFIILRVLPPT